MEKNHPGGPASPESASTGSLEPGAAATAGGRLAELGGDLREAGV